MNFAILFNISIPYIYYYYIVSIWKRQEKYKESKVKTRQDKRVPKQKNADYALPVPLLYLVSNR